MKQKHHPVMHSVIAFFVVMHTNQLKRAKQFVIHVHALLSTKRKREYIKTTHNYPIISYRKLTSVIKGITQSHEKEMFPYRNV